MTEYAFEGAKRASAAVSWSFETQTLPRDALYPFSAPIATAFQATVQAAFARWAGISGVTFTQVADNGTADIRIGFGAFSSSEIVGQTLLRLGDGGALSPDTVIRLLDPAVQPLSLDPTGAYSYGAYGITLFQVTVHEIGHALGLDHTTDPSTIMYPVATGANRDLAAGDIEGINALYPLYTVTALDPLQPASGPGGTASFHFTIARYSDPSAALTVGYAVTGAQPALAGSAPAPASTFGGETWPSGQVVFAPGATAAALTVAVPGNAAALPDLGFALTVSSLSAAAPATTRGSNLAVILDDNGYEPGAGVLNVYRFFSVASGTHFYTDSEAERNATVLARPDLVYEGAAMEALAPASLGADAAATPVYRFFDTRFGTHFYTSSGAERDAVAATRPDLVAEGVGFYEDAVQRPGDAAVYRYFNAVNGTHFYTASAAERASIAASRPDLVSEGVAFFAPTPA